MPYLENAPLVPKERLNDKHVRRHVEGFLNGSDPVRHLAALVKLGVVDLEEWKRKLKSS